MDVLDININNGEIVEAVIESPKGISVDGNAEVTASQAQEGPADVYRDRETNCFCGPS